MPRSLLNWHSTCQSHEPSVNRARRSTSPDTRATIRLSNGEIQVTGSSLIVRSYGAFSEKFVPGVLALTALAIRASSAALGVAEVSRETLRINAFLSLRAVSATSFLQSVLKEVPKVKLPDFSMIPEYRVRIDRGPFKGDLRAAKGREIR